MKSTNAAVVPALTMLALAVAACDCHYFYRLRGENFHPPVAVFLIFPPLECDNTATDFDFQNQPDGQPDDAE